MSEEGALTVGLPWSAKEAEPHAVSVLNAGNALHVFKGSAKPEAALPRGN